MFVSCKHLKVIVMATDKIIVMARTKRGKTLSKGLRDLCAPLFWDKGDTTHAQKGSLWVKHQGRIPGHNESCSSQKPSLQDPSWLRGCVPTPGTRQLWRIIALKEKALSYINDLATSLLCSTSLGGTPTLFLSGVYLCLASMLTKQTASRGALLLVVLLYI